MVAINRNRWSQSFGNSGRDHSECARKANLIKIVFWDGTGLCLFTKRLEQGRFPWPGADEAGDTLALTSEQLSMLIGGIDWRAPERTWRPAVAG